MPEKDIYFYHIMKTAGTSVFKILEDAYGQETMCPFPTHQGAEEDAFKEKIKAEYPLIVAGHPDHLFHLWELTDTRPNERFSMTFLRNPIDRYISCYYFLSRSKYVNKHVEEYDMSIEEAMESGHPRFSDNIMTKTLASLGTPRDYAKPASSEDFMKAVAALEQFDFIGIQEEFDLSCALLTHLLGVAPPVLVKWNVNNKYPGRQELGSEIVRRISFKNMYDLELFSIATEMFHARLAEAGDTLGTRLKEMKISDAVYKVRQK